MNRQPGVSVLVVDDSYMIRRVLRHILERDHRIDRLFEACDVAEGYSLFKVCRPDAVVLDLALADLNGIELVKMIKDSTPSCVVVVLTDCRDEQIREECFRRGADWFLNKETNLINIRDTIVTLCSSKRQNSISAGNDPRPTKTRPGRTTG